MGEPNTAAKFFNMLLTVGTPTGKIVGKSSNPKKYLRTLQAVEHGFRPIKKV